MKPQDRILILDFGSQYTQLIARRVREAGVYCEIHPYDVGDDAIQEFDPKGVVLSGGPESVNANPNFRAPDCVFELGVPVMGICYGMQTIAHQLGGEVSFSEHEEFGHADLQIHESGSLFSGIDAREIAVWMSHGDQVTQMPPGFECLASSGNTEIAAMGDHDRHIYAVQFHPEVTHTQHGQQMINNFVHTVCGFEHFWQPKNIIEESVNEIREQVGADKVILGLSGGIDSSVVACLVHRAIGDQLTCVFVDTGFMRAGEAQEIHDIFAEHQHIKMIEIHAQDRFYAALENVDDPEEKRRIAGNLFVEIFEEAAHRVDGAKWLAQGTIYPDVIESAGGKFNKSHVIKTHHNVGGLPEKMGLKLLEPIRQLFKDEVRKLGRALGLPESLVKRHPFPGPGLCVRVMGPVNPQFTEIVRQADRIFMEELEKANYYNRVDQAFAVFLPVKSVGVMGDARRYEYVIALRAVETEDYMTARWAHLPYELIAQVSLRIVNEVKHVARVVYDVTGKPPGTIEWE